MTDTADVTNPQNDPLLAPEPRRPRVGLVVAIVVAAVVVLLAGTVAVTAAIARHVGPAASPTRTAAARACPSTGCTLSVPVKPAAPPPTEVVKPIGISLIATSSGVAGETESSWTANVDKEYSVTPDGYSRPEKGVFFAILVDVNVTAGSELVSDNDFALVAPDGTAYESSSDMYAWSNALRTIELHAGQQTEGLVVFDAPKDAIPHGRVELRLFGGQAQQAYWQLP